VGWVGSIKGNKNAKEVKLISLDPRERMVGLKSSHQAAKQGTLKWHRVVGGEACLSTSVVWCQVHFLRDSLSCFWSHPLGVVVGCVVLSVVSGVGGCGRVGWGGGGGGWGVGGGSSGGVGGGGCGGGVIGGVWGCFLGRMGERRKATRKGDGHVACERAGGAGGAAELWVRGKGGSCIVYKLLFFVFFGLPQRLV